jgi:hypothetical protein
MSAGGVVLPSTGTSRGSNPFSCRSFIALSGVRGQEVFQSERRAAVVTSLLETLSGAQISQIRHNRDRRPWCACQVVGPPRISRDFICEAACPTRPLCRRPGIPFMNKVRRQQIRFAHWTPLPPSAFLTPAGAALDDTSDMLPDLGIPRPSSKRDTRPGILWRRKLP